MADLVGHNLGNYRIVSRLGRGGMGEVYRAVHILLNRPAAIKVLHADQAVDSTFQARFLREARAAAALSHPNIVEVFDFGEQDDNSYLVMELVPDGSLRSLLRQRGKGAGWSLGMGVDLARQTAEGLAYAHAHGMVHRDIKPDNLLLQRLEPPTDANGEERYLLKISDFGLARLVEDTSELTVTGMVMGTPAYMSPEQCQGGVIDGRSDLYSLGVVLYELATGAPPFRVKTLSEAVFKHISAPPIPPREVQPDLPIALQEVILRCLAKAPEDRYATGTELAEALEDALTDTAATTIVSVPGGDRLTPASGASGASGGVVASRANTPTPSAPMSAPTMQSEPSLAIDEVVGAAPSPATVASDPTAPIDAAETQRAELPAAANDTAPAAPPSTPSPALPAAAQTPLDARKSPGPTKPTPRTPPAARLSPTGAPAKPSPGASSATNKKSTGGQGAQSSQISQVRQNRQTGQPRQTSGGARPAVGQQKSPQATPANRPAPNSPTASASPPVAPIRSAPPIAPMGSPAAPRVAAPAIVLEPLPADRADRGGNDYRERVMRLLGPLGRRPLALGLGGIGVVALIIILIVALALGNRHTPTAAVSRTPSPTLHNSATATPQPTATPKTQVVFQDSMATNDRKWFTSGSASFANGGYTIQGYLITYAPTHNLGNVTVSVRVRELSGPTDQFYGLVFRGANSNTYYFFGVSANQRWTFTNGAPRNGKAIVAPTSNSHIAAGLGASNTLTVTATGGHFVFSVNGVMVGQANDGAISSGTIALAVPVDHLTAVYNDFIVSVPA